MSAGNMEQGHHGTDAKHGWLWEGGAGRGKIWNGCQARGTMKRVPSAGKLMQGNSASEWWAFSEALEYVVHTLSNEKWFPSKYHGSLWEVGWSGPWRLSILCCGLELLKINNIHEIIELLNRGGSRIFFRRGCTRLLLYFNTNKPHSFFFGRIPVVLENRRSSREGGCAPPAPSPRSAPA